MTKQTSSHFARCCVVLLAFSIGCLASILAPPAQADPQLPAAVGLESLKLNGPFSAAAISPNGRRAYLGRQYSYSPKRLNLVVVTLGDNGKAVGEPRSYMEADLPLPDRTNFSIQCILPDAVFHKLYLCFNYSSANPTYYQERLLSVYDTDADGEPIGRPRTYNSGNPRCSLIDLARHPKLNLLYMCGWGFPGILVYKLDPNGEPTGEPHAFPLGGQGKYQLAVSPDGGKLYAGSYPDKLEVLNLDANGMPTGQPRTFAAGSEQEYLRFRYTPQSLYLSRNTPDGSKLAKWPLDADGNPIDEPQTLADLATTQFAVDIANKKLWFASNSAFKDPFDDKVVVDGVAVKSAVIGDDGSPGPAQAATASLNRQAAVAMVVAANGRPLLLTQTLPGGFRGNRLQGDQFRIKLLGADSRKGPPDQLHFLRGTAPLGIVRMGDYSAWINLDTVLKGKASQVVLEVNTDRTDLTDLKLQIEVGHSNAKVAALPVQAMPGDDTAGDEGPAALKVTTYGTKIEEVVGNTVLFLVPGYGYDPPAERDAAFELLSEHARQYLATAQAVGLKPEERPRQFMVSCYGIMGGQGSLSQLDTELQTCALLGFNTSNCYWWGNIPPAKLNEELVAHGIARRSLAIYNPPSYFDFDQKVMNPTVLAKWAADLMKGAATSGGTPADVIDCKMADEPGWYYPVMIEHVKTDPDALEYFRNYLQSAHLQPVDVGCASWDAVFPIGASQATDLPSRRLFYWTMRLFPDSAARDFKLARAALEKLGPNLRYVDVNLNNWPNLWYSASPNAKIANNTNSGPDAAMGEPDWLADGRAGSNTPWTEDWFGDADAQEWSFRGDLLKSQAMETGQDFGGYVVGCATGGFPSGGRLKMLSLVGHGAKALDVYTFGPELLFPGNCWSESFGAYANIADGLRMLGRGERLLYPGRLERGKVAIMTAGSSTLWEKSSAEPEYAAELTALHYALTYAGYTIDFVDDTDVIGGALATRGYKVLYVTAPNVLQGAQERIATWVHDDGGTLVALPGAAVADEYNTPTSTLDAALGLKPRTDIRDGAARSVAETSDTLSIADLRFGQGDIDLHGQIAPLIPADNQGAAVLAHLKSGAAGITASRYGAGRTIAYAFYPGRQFWQSADRSNSGGLPINWGLPQMKLAVAPAELAGTAKVVTLSQFGVEACRLQSPAGIALVLLNWTGQPIRSLKIDVPAAGKFHKVSSLDHGAVTATTDGDTLHVTVPLNSADVLMIEP